MPNPVLDSYALLAFLFQEKGAEKVAALFEKALEIDQPLLMASPNWAEVRYMIERKVGTGRWSEVRQKVLALPMEIVAADQAMAELAGKIKASKKISLADCFAAALAQQRNSEIYTGDPEFRALESELKIVWL
ncbi:MAG: type II toxin-antitoxin system VapC family toxin [Proteobacteria bacterium]|nr:type II toxin-antitoxin system VapC family toxin [Pseudomonadota bacterium]